ncbi:hypothetical protein GC163_01465 [bacterium]|nr:hypothetical protein [bacterium]
MNVRWFAPWTWSRWKLVVLFGLPGLLLCYVASGGPAVWLVERDYLRVETVEWVYRPVISLDKYIERHFESLSYCGYLDRWSVRGTDFVIMQRQEVSGNLCPVIDYQEENEEAQGMPSLGFNDHASDG